MIDAGKKKWLIVGGGAAGLVLVIVLYKKGASGSSSSTSSTSGTDPLTGLPYSEDDSTDPVTGMTYLTEAQQYGSVTAAESAVSGGSAFGLAGSDSGFSGTAGFPTSNVGTGSATSTSYATNAAWAQAVTAGLVGLGYTSTDVAAALGLFFAQHPLGTAADGVSYAEIVQAAEAEFGPPPQGTYSIIPVATTATTPPPASTTTTTTSAAVSQYAAPKDLRLANVTTDTARIDWNAVSPAPPSYTVQVGTSTKTTTGTSFTITGLQPGRRYNVKVWANGGKKAPPGATLTFGTHKK